MSYHGKMGRIRRTPIWLAASVGKGDAAVDVTGEPRWLMLSASWRKRPLFHFYVEAGR